MGQERLNNLTSLQTEKQKVLIDKNKVINVINCTGPKSERHITLPWILINNIILLLWTIKIHIQVRNLNFYIHPC